MCIDPCFADSFTGKVLPDLPVFFCLQICSALRLPVQKTAPKFIPANSVSTSENPFFLPDTGLTRYPKGLSF